MKTRSWVRIAPLITSGVAVVGTTVALTMPLGTASLFAAAPAPAVQTQDITLTATAGGVLGSFIGFFIGNGTNAAADCVGSACNGGNAGILLGDGGNGANGGKGGNAGLLFGNGGNGGNGNFVLAGTFGLSVNGGSG